MAEPSAEQLETMLRQVAAAAPDPWYPKLHAEATGVPRDDLDAPLERLRLAGLLRLTDWMEGRGQGYALTPEGMHALKDGKTLARVRDGRVVRPAAAAPKPRDFRGETAWDRGERIREALLYPPTPVVTRFILFVYLAVFMVGLVLAQQQKLPLNLYLYGGSNDGAVQIALGEIIHELGAVNGEEIVRGQWWRLVTACFVHIGLLHLGLNCFGLYTLGRFLEPLMGPVRFAALYLIAGVGGSCLALITTIFGLAGGSGALCGLLGGVAVWVVLNRSYLPSPIVAMLQRNIVINIILMVFISLVPGVSWAGHLGGAVAGVIAAVLLHYQRYGPAGVRLLAAAGLPLVPAIAVGALLYMMNTQPRWVQLKEAVRAVEAHEEGRALRERYRREALPADTAARKAYEDAFELLQKRPGIRDLADREKAIKSLAQARTDVAEVIQNLSAGSRLRDAAMEERKGAIEYLQALADLCATTQSYLQENSSVLDEELQRLRDETRKVGEFQQRWARFIQ